MEFSSAEVADRIDRQGSERIKRLFADFNIKPAGFGLPQVAVFGSTSPLHTPPLSDRARVLWLKDELGLDCMPCFDRTCRFGHYRCLTEVTPDRALAALDSARS